MLHIDILRARVLNDGQEVDLQPRILELCVALAAHQQGLRGADICDLLYPGLDEVAAWKRLRVYVCRLRRQLPGALVGAGRLRYKLSADASTDLQQLSDMCRLASARGSSSLPAQRIISALDQLLSPRRGFPFDRWSWYHSVELQVDELTTDFLDALVATDAWREQSGVTLRLARQAIDYDPCNEVATKLSILSLIALRREVAAVREFERYREALRRELGIEAPQEIRALLKTPA